MSKALPWNIKGVGFDAREAARDAARREGLSLGEWLHGVIADSAAPAQEHGRYAAAPSEQDRIESVTSRLERLSAAAARPRGRIAERDRPRRDDWERQPESQSERRLRVVADEDEHRRRDYAAEDVAENPVVEAVAALEARSQRSERRTEDALATVARYLESAEARRTREQAGVDTLAERLADIESRLAAQDPNPIKGALARLEARLEQIGLRNEAEARAPRSEPAPVERLEHKLNAVLEALSARPAPPQASAAAIAAAQERAPVELPLRRRRLGDAIAEIADRQRSLETSAAKPAGLFGAARVPERRVPPPVDLEGLREDIATMAGQLRGLAPRGSVAALEGQLARIETQLGAADSGGALGELRAEMRALESQLHDIHDLVERRTAAPDVASLEGLLRDLTARIEAVQAPNAGQPALDALQHQIGTLTSRLEANESGLASLATIERSMRDLFTHLDETRSFAETAAARAAHEAVRIAIADKGFDRPAPRADVAVLKAMQEDADLRTRSTLDAMQSVLEKVVDRLASVENGLTDVQGATSARSIDSALNGLRAADPAATPASAPSLGAAKPMLDTPRQRPAARRSAAIALPSDAVDARPDYIAAARRAAQAAQTDPSVVAMREGEPNDLREGLAVKSRDFVASHKRPVLLSLAAVLVVAITTALVQLAPFPSTSSQVAGYAAPPARVAAAEPSRQPRLARTADANDALSPSALPRSTPALPAKIPGSDPIPTASMPTASTPAASIPSLPAFAASPRQSIRQPTLPAGLVAAADAGDAAAQYTLACAYAEGRLAPRDFGQAARYYAKAADQGIVPAQYRLGALYEKGLGVAQDKARAKSLYRQAADAGNPRAMHNLAVLLADGDGKPDYEGAATWFRKAAQYGIHDSQFNLAILLVRGLGVEPSLVQSYQWFAIAAAQGDTDAAGKRDEIGAKLSPSELSVAKALAAAFHARAPDPAATDVTPPPGGWDSAPAPVHLNSARSKISSL
ncbi:putative Sel1 repeat protein [Beijerinckiaceae bacterium RH AL1]|nr:putative Sel1 repeat protein [Beijerinckiaceae bacterium RH CH11]VVB47630.1 putative Sel1 repeat protein [Beijerinckiaceae bacterium RH AL8]VVC55945.1 putative Sel1 repeat protein [Beijerinckiaceae bacterium RH AL1]